MTSMFNWVTSIENVTSAENAMSSFDNLRMQSTEDDAIKERKFDFVFVRNEA